MSALPPIAEMEAARERRDPAYDGIFFVCVKTTGIFCRPTCPARTPLAKNVEYFATAAEALFAGYRPCKRCRPMAIVNQPEWATALIAEVEANPQGRIREGDLRKRGIDPATVRRHFMREYGMTFQAYCRARRLTHAFTSIKSGAMVDDAVLESGYDSHSGFRDAFLKTFGIAPGKSNKKDCVFVAWIQSPLGPLVAGATDEGICLLEFTDRRMLEAQFQTVRRHFQVPVVPGTNRHLERLQAELAEYFEGKLSDFTVPLVFPGSPFQRKVWEELLRVPYGETRSYQDLAYRIGSAAAVRAVGRANAVNRIGIIIPCHRIVNKNGELGGYGGGLRRKQFLLDLERSHRVTEAAS